MAAGVGGSRTEQTGRVWDGTSQAHPGSARLLSLFSLGVVVAFLLLGAAAVGVLYGLRRIGGRRDSRRRDEAVRESGMWTDPQQARFPHYPRGWRS